MKTIGRRIVYLQSLDIDRDQFWALLLPFLSDSPPSAAERGEWLEQGVLPKRLAKAAEKERESQTLREQTPTYRQKSRF